MRLTHCTLTGVDEQTDLQKLAALSARFPIAEWGFLYSPKRQGQPGRYPAVALLRKAFSELPAHVRVAMHVCGQGVHDLLAGETVVTELVALAEARGGRIQLNFNQKRDPIDFDSMRAFLSRHPALPVITQYNSANESVWQELQGAGNHMVLFDASGGRGFVAEAWPAPIAGISCGYAGGLGREIIAAQLQDIAIVVGTNNTWVDMEGSLRVDDAAGIDWFCLDHCEDCLKVASESVPRPVPETELAGYWVPVGQWHEQKLLAKTGNWQVVRCFNGVVVKACVLAGREGWWDGNYFPIDGVTEWLKPQRWFRSADDIDGDQAAMAAFKASLPRSPLREVGV